MDSRVGLGLITDHNSPIYASRRNALRSGKYNGAYYYSIDIVKNIIPNVFTTRNWCTMGIEEEMMDNSICFIHHNINSWKYYKWLAKYKNVIAVCSRKDVTEEISRLATAIYLPLSIDIADVERYKTSKTKHACYVGNLWNARKTEIFETIPDDIDIITNMPREEILKTVAQYEVCYAIGRCAMEAKVLGCEVRPSVPSVWMDSWHNPLDNKDAAKILKEEINEIDLKKSIANTSPHKATNINVNKHRLEDVYFE